MSGRSTYPIWRSKSLSPTERLALVYLKESVACPGGRGPWYHQRAPADLAVACGIPAAQAHRLWREFVARFWMREIAIADGGPYDGQPGWVMVEVAGYEL